MVRTLLVRGMLVGIVAGLLSFGFLKVYGEPQVDRAIAFETQLDEAKAAAEKAKGMKMSDEDEPELVSRAGAVRARLVHGRPSLQRSVWWPVRSGIRLRVWAHAGCVDATSFVGIAGGDRVHCDLSRAEPEISGKSAIGRRPRDDRGTNFTVFPHDRDFACGHGRIGNAQTLVGCSSGGMERQSHRGGMLYRRGRNRLAPASGGQRSSGRVSSRRAVEIPDCLSGSAIHHVGDAGLAVWSLDPADFGERQFAGVTLRRNGYSEFRH